MDPVLLAVDTILRSIIGPANALDDLIEKAKAGEVYFLMPDFVLFCALSSVKSSDQVNFQGLAELIRYSQVEPEYPEYLGAGTRESWKPSSEEIQNWRESALE